MVTRVLFVCLGNICRSPAAEAVFRQVAAASGLEVATDSAGTSDWHIGNPPYRPMIRAAAARGYDLSMLRARQFRRGDFSDFDLIIGMDGENIGDIERLRPAGSQTPVARLLDFAPQCRLRDVPDPYYSSDFDGALDLIETAIHGLLNSLS
ncbi:MAG: low molecular weight protein-tyrosine-phosphatase [Paracoccaceae bacterium]